MDDRERLDRILADFNAATGCRLRLDGTGGCEFTYGEMPVSLQYLPQSGLLLLWTFLPCLGDDQNGVHRAEWLLARMDGLIESNGFTYALAGEDDLVMVADRRSLAEVSDADGFAAWLEALANEASKFVYAAECLFPYVDDDPLPGDDEEEVR